MGLGSCLLLFGLGGVLGYLALGDAVAGSFLLALQDSAPAWVLVLGSVMVVLNMVPAYQVGVSHIHTSCVVLNVTPSVHEQASGQKPGVVAAGCPTTPPQG